MAQEPVTRRDFAIRAAAAAVAAPMVASEKAKGATADEPADDTKPTLRPPHELLTDVLRQKFPHEKLKAETVDLIRADIAGDLGRSIALDKFPLKNSDEPGFVFSAWRAES